MQQDLASHDDASYAFGERSVAGSQETPGLGTHTCLISSAHVVSLVPLGTGAGSEGAIDPLIWKLLAALEMNRVKRDLGLLSFHTVFCTIFAWLQMSISYP